MYLENHVHISKKRRTYFIKKHVRHIIKTRQYYITLIIRKFFLRKKVDLLYKNHANLVIQILQHFTSVGYSLDVIIYVKNPKVPPRSPFPGGSDCSTPANPSAYYTVAQSDRLGQGSTGPAQ